MRERLKANTALLVAFGVVCLFVAQLRAAGQASDNPIVSVTVTAPATDLLRGNTLQLTVRGRFADGSERDVTADPATLYTALPEDVAIVEAGGVVRGLSPGPVTIVVSHEPMDELPASTTIDLVVRVPNDRDGDLMTDAYEIQHGLNPDDPSDGAADPDGDGLSNLRESILGTDPHNADTDGDGLPDGLEVAMGTNPLDAASPTPAPREPRLDQNCTASIQNRSVQVNEDGSFAIPNVPVDVGYYRVRAICRQPDGTTASGQSPFFLLQADGSADIQNIEIVFGTVDPIPVSLQIATATNLLNTRGETAQLTVTGTLPNGITKPLTQETLGTSYATSNPLVATVSRDGLVTAVGRGQVVISARNEGVLGSLVFNVAVPNDADNDGMTDEAERANGLNPNDPNDAGQDPDGDGLTNLEEFRLGTNPRSADTDGDGLSDGEEVRRGTNPLAADTDLDGLTDAQEIALGTNPLVADTDGDGISDGLEVRLGLQPLVFTPTTTVQGRVVDVTGAAVEGASALVLGGLFTGQTTATGVFRILNVPATLGPLVTLARIVRNNQLLDGMSEAVAAIAEGITDVQTIQVAVSSGVISGLITDPQNVPVIGAQVTLTMGLDARTAMTDVTGRYRIANVQTGAVTLTAVDPRTSLRGRIAGVVPQNQPLTLDLRLGAFGSVAGTVFQRDTTTPVGPGVSVSLSGPAVASTQTDANGRYAFDFIPLSGFTLEASDTTGNRGRTTGSLTFTGQTAVANVAFLARGNVGGLVADGAGNPVANATVTLSDGSIFGGSRTMNSDALGRYTFLDVFVGTVNVTARSPLSGLGGQASGTLDSEGQTIDLRVTLAATGTLIGRVSRAGTAQTPAASARVQLSNGLVTTADTQGNYRFDFVPVGGQGIVATELATGDRGNASVTIAANQTTTANITLNGLAPVTVVVRDGADQLVAGARVNINGAFGSFQQGLTAADGTIAFPRVFVGAYSVSAFNPATQLSGSATGTAVLGSTTTTTVRLQPYGAISGTVVAPDNTTPASNVTVQLSGSTFRRAINPPGGAFRFDILPTGSYRLDVIDQYGSVRAFTSGIVLDHQSQEETRRLVLLGAGTVTGTVTAPDGTPATNVTVFLSGGRSTQSLTDIAGRYSIPGVPLGPFSVSASRRSGNQQLFGAAQGEIASDGATVTADITLSASLVPTTTTLHDVNGFEFGLRENGSIQDGTKQFFGGDFAGNRGGALLDVTVGGTTTRFTGQSLGTSENGGRQIGIAQTGIGPLDVTRKIFVPLNGYFARYLELFRNPGTTPVTFDVRVTSYSRYISKLQNGFRFNREPRIVSTSSGDAFLGLGEDPDRWLVLDDDENLDPFVSDTLPSVAHVFEGATATLHASAAAFDLQPNFGQLTNEWRGLTLQPGETIALMHFVSQETTREAAQAAATRLVQAPPEALVNGTVPDLIASVQQLQSLTQLLATESRGLEDFFQGGPNTFLATNTSIQSLAAEVDAQVPALQSLAASSPTATQIRTVAVAVSGLTDRVRQAVAAAPGTPYCVTGSGSCPTIRSLGDAAPGIFRDFVNTASSSATRADAARVTASGVQELSLVRNFALPLAGGSSVAPLPALNGTIAGRVLAANQVPQAGAAVAFRSNHPLFNRTFPFTTDGAGQYRVQSSLVDGNSLPVPVDGFALRATHPQTGLQSPELVATFPAGFASATGDIVFTNSGQLAGVVRHASGAVASGGSVLFAGGGFGLGGLVNSLSVPIGIDGAFSVSGLPGGNYNLVATLPEPQGTPLTAARLALVVEGQTRPADLAIAPIGGVSGTVRRATGGVVPGIPVQLRTSTLSRSTTTDTGGRYAFSDVLTEVATVEAFDRATNTAGTGTVTVVPDVVTPLDLSLTVGGTVTGIIRLANAPIAGAQVTVQWTGGSITTQTGTDGRYRVDHITPGPVTVRASNANGVGGNAGTLGLSGDTLTLDVGLFAGGTVSGTVFRAGTTQAVGGVEVSISRYVPGLPSTVTTNTQGQFTFEAVPVGTFSLNALDPATGDRGATTNQVNANAEQRVVNVTLNGQGRVTVTVRDASENLINHAHVIVSSQTQFGGSQSGDTAADGTVVFDRVLAGSFFVSATDPATQLAGSTTGTVAVSGTATADVHLQPAGTVLGRVYSSDGITPAGGVQVQLHTTYYYGLTRQVNTAADGSYRFDAVPLDTYILSAYDGEARLRARSANVQLSGNGQIATQNLTLVGLGRISGIVTNPNGTPAVNVGVSVRSTSVIGGFFNASTDSDGSYRVLSVPAGGFVATAQTQQLIGETTGRITSDGQQVTANIQLQDNGIYLPVYRYDGNSFYYNLRNDGSIGDSTYGLFGGDFGANYGAFFLDIFSQGTPTRFSGGTIGTTEENGREIAVRQQGLAGLNVTRKMFLDPTGYFTRYVEILSNPTPDPITVDVRVQNNLRPYYSAPQIVTTSSGDAELHVDDPATADRWVVTGDAYDGDPYVNGTLPETAFVFDGANGAEHAAAADLQYPSGGYSFGQLQYRWNNVTVPPGGTVAYLHFGVQETSRAAALAAAQRLELLPPEALVGLDATEISEIRNFAVPADGISLLDPISLGGAISGQVFEHDGTTPVPNITVTVQSNDALYSRRRNVSTDANGAFSITSQTQPLGSYGNVVVPIEPFTISATYPQSNVQSGNLTGSFLAGQTLAVRNVVFTNTSVVSGTVRLATGAPVTSGGYVQLERNSPTYAYRFANLGNDGTFRLGGVPPGTYTQTTVEYHPQGSSRVVTRVLTIPGDQFILADVSLPATGSVDGVISDAGGNPAPNAQVYLHSPNWSVTRVMYTPNTGAFLLTEVPPGGYVLDVTEPNTGIVTSVPVTVTANQTTTQNVTLVALGTLDIQVNFAGGGGAAGAQVRVNEALRGPGYFRFVGYTDGSGHLRVGNIAVGALIVRAYNPNNNNLFGDTPGALVNHGDTVAVTVALPPTGIITGHVTNALGTANVAHSYVQAVDPTTQYEVGAAYTDSNGAYTLTQVAAGRPVTLRAYTPNFGMYRQVENNVIPGDGATLTVDIALPAVASLRITVLQADETPYTQTQIYIRHVNNGYFQYYGATDQNGVLVVQGIPEGDYSVLAQGSNGVSRGAASGHINQTDDGGTVDVTIHAPLSGNVTGTVFAGDGQTPIASAYVEALETASGNNLAQTYTDQDGHYSFTGLIPGGDQVTLRSTVWWLDSTVRAEATTSFTTPGETKTVDLTMAFSVITGKVSFSDGTPVPNPNVFATTQTDQPRSFYANRSLPDGTYSLLAVPVGTDVVVTGQDPDSGLSGTAPARVDAIATAVTVNVTLAASGTVEGTLRKEDGTPVAGGEVALIHPIEGFVRYTSTDDDGHYSFAHVLFGAIRLEACDFGGGGDIGVDRAGIQSVTQPAAGVCGHAEGVVSESTPAVTIDVILPGAGGVQGSVTDNGTPVTDAYVTVETLGLIAHNIRQSISTDSAGHYEFSGVPAGDIRVTAHDPNNWSRVGIATSAIVEDQTTTLDIPLGNAVQFGRLNLDGADGFRYDVECDGSLNDGGLVDRSLTNAYDGTYYLTDPAFNNWFSCVDTGRLGQNGREVAIGPSQFLGMTVTRKIYVPEQGGFARYLEVVQNPTSVEQHVTLQVTGWVGSGGVTRVVVAPAATDNHYAVTDGNGACCVAVAHVFSGPGGAVNATDTHFVSEDGEIFHRWNLTVPANGTIILMHFTAQRDPSDGGAAAGAQAQALMNLSDPHALDGMTDVDRSEVVNFAVPAP